eukprot:TRINITY_DN1379_c0_g1_i2.p1 TRINITY_DN1379_c0_g1~~TRINITY_DN1379_c0_g1_i2.p1  ORF type:complete len:606 (+),score=155.30 TRINITY_DN1379_c0_g1_i2:342-2159(+)
MRRSFVSLCSFCFVIFGIYGQTVDRNYLCNNIVWGTYAAPPWENGQNMDRTKAVDTLFSRNSQIVHWYANWDDGTGDFGGTDRQNWLKWVDDLAAADPKTDRTPMITWQPWKKNPSNNNYDVNYNYYTPSSILNGNHDTYINSAAAGLKKYGKKVYLRPFHEFDGNWYPWGAQNNQADPLKNAWRYIHGKFQTAGATNVLFVWCPNHANSQNVNQENYFPGDSYVDWACFDVYSDYPSVSFADSLGKNAAPQNPYDRITAVTKKPIMIGEFGVKAQGTTPRSEWFKQLALDLPTKLPQVKALVFFNAGDYSLSADSTTSNAIASLFGKCSEVSTPSSSSTQIAPTPSSSSTQIAPAPTVVTPQSLTPNLYYSFDTPITDNTVADDSGNGKSGQIQSNPTIQTGKFGKAMRFVQNGTATQTIKVKDGNNFAGVFSVSFWVQLSSKLDTRMKVCSSKSAWNDPTGWQLEIYPTLSSISFVGSYDSVAAWQNLPFVYGEWVHIAVTVNDAVATLFLNGNQISSIAIAPVKSSQAPLYIASDGGANALTGSLDEFRIFGIVLTPSQITQIIQGINPVIVGNTVAQFAGESSIVGYSLSLVIVLVSLLLL